MLQIPSARSGPQSRTHNIWVVSDTPHLHSHCAKQLASTILNVLDSTGIRLMHKVAYVGSMAVGLVHGRTRLASLIIISTELVQVIRVQKFLRLRSQLTISIIEV